MSSLWVAILLPVLYYGPNRAYFTGIRDLDDAGFWQALSYSGLDAAVELGIFVLLVVFLRLNTGRYVFKTFLGYLELKSYLFAFAATCVLVPLLTLAFFLEHNGMDPTFDFAWLDREGEFVRL